MKREPARTVLEEIQTLYTVGSLGAMSDAQLLELFLSERDQIAEDAFATLVDRHGPMVLGVCRRILACEHAAEDAFQATFLILARKAALIGRREHVGSWLHGVAIRTAKEAKRREARQIARERRLMNQFKTEVQDAPEDDHSRRETLRMLDEEMESLPSQYRTAMIACEIQGKSRRDAAAMLGLPEGTLSTNLARGRKLLRERLERRGVSLGALPLLISAGSSSTAVIPEHLASETVRTAMSCGPRAMAAGTASASVVTLAETVIKGMSVTKLAAFSASIAAIGLSAAVTWTFFPRGPGNPPEPAQVKTTALGKPSTAAIKEPATEPKSGPRGVHAHGIVVDESGKPSAGIEVWVAGSAADEQECRGVTNSSGQFDFIVHRPRLTGIFLRAASRDRASQGTYSYGFSTPTHSAKQQARIVLKPARELTVRVVDRDRSPVAGAIVAALTERMPLADGLTNAGGLWIVRLPPETEEWSVFARKSNLGFDYAASPAKQDGSQLQAVPNALTLTLNGAQSMRVTAVDRLGSPIAGVRIGLQSIQKPGHQWFSNWFFDNPRLWPATGQDGSVVIDWLPPQLQGGFQLGTHAENLYSFNNSGVLVSPNRPIEPVTITFLPVEKLSGHVKFADGRPAAGIEVSISGRGPADGRGGNQWNASATTDADGRYQIDALSEQVYVVAVDGKEWAAPFKAGIVVHAGKPLDNVDFVVGRPTRVHGRLLIGEKSTPTPNSMIRLFIHQPMTSDALRIKGEQYHPQAEMNRWIPTDESGEYEAYLGPGDYAMTGQQQNDWVALSIPAHNPPPEITQDIHETAPPTTGPLTIQVVDTQNRPIAGAIVGGHYPSRRARGWFTDVKTDERGRLQTERTHVPLYLYAKSADGKSGEVKRLPAEVSECQIVLRPVATAIGRLLDLDGKKLADRSLNYGIRIHVDEDEDNAFLDAFGGTAQTDAEGRFSIPGLVVGQNYEVALALTDKSWRGVTTVMPKGGGSIDLGDRRVDTLLNRPYVPPTPQERAASAFSHSAEMPPLTQKQNLLAEARRERTRPLLLFGRPKDRACVDLFRAFYAGPNRRRGDRAAKNEPPPASVLRWEYELACLDTDQPAVRQFAAEFGVTAAGGGDNSKSSPILVVLDDDGSPVATYPLRIDGQKELNRRDLSTFLLSHKLAARDAQKLLEQALLAAKDHDKRVFLIFSASWCNPCRQLARLLDSQSKELERHYVFVRLDIDRDLGAERLHDRYPESKNEGIPWYAILDSTGKELITSNAPRSIFQTGSTNISVPNTRKDLDHFIHMLKTTAPRLNDEALEQIKAALLATMRQTAVPKPE